MTDGVGNLKWAACTDLKHWIPESRQSDETGGMDESGCVNRGEKHRIYEDG